MEPGGIPLRSNLRSARRTPGLPRLPPSVPASIHAVAPALAFGAALLIKVSAAIGKSTVSAYALPATAASAPHKLMIALLVIGKNRVELSYFNILVL